MGRFPSPYDTPSTPGSVAPANDPLASPPTSMLIPYPDDDGPGVADQPYPNPSDGGTGNDDDDNGSGY